MDIGAIVIDPFEPQQLPVLHDAVRRAMHACGLDVGKAQTAYAASAALGRGIVAHLRVSGDDDEHDPYLLLTDHPELGAEIRRALSCPGPVAVVAVSCEGRTGSCLVAEEGRRVSAEGEGPLRALAKRLGGSLESLMAALQTPDTDWLPVNAQPTEAAIVSLAKRRSQGPLPKKPTRKERGATFALYLPTEVCRDAQLLAGRLGISLGELLSAAWETSKAEVYASTPVVDLDSDVASHLVAPAALVIKSLMIPDSAPAVSEIAGGDNVLLEIVVPSSVAEEVQVLSRAADRAQSWVMKAAYLAARGRLHQAQRVPGR